MSEDEYWWKRVLVQEYTLASVANLNWGKIRLYKTMLSYHTQWESWPTRSSSAHRKQLFFFVCSLDAYSQGGRQCISNFLSDRPSQFFVFIFFHNSFYQEVDELSSKSDSRCVLVPACIHALISRIKMKHWIFIRILFIYSQLWPSLWRSIGVHSERFE